MGRIGILGAAAAIAALAGFGTGRLLSHDSPGATGVQSSGSGSGRIPTIAGHGDPSRARGDSPRGGDEEGAEVAELSLGELRELSEPERLDYLLRLSKTDPLAAFRLAVEWDKATGAHTSPGSYVGWIVKATDQLDAVGMGEVLAGMNLLGWEKNYLENRIERLVQIQGSPEERLTRILEGAQWSTHGNVGRALQELSESDPAAALSYLERALKERPESLGWGLEHTMLVNLAGADLDAFERLTRGARQENLKRMFGNALVAVLGERDVTAALAFVDAMPLSKNRTQATVFLAQGWGRTDPAAAVAWAMKELKGVARMRAMAAALPPEFVSANAEQVVKWFRDAPEFQNTTRGSERIGYLTTYSSDGGQSYGSGSDLSGVREVSQVFEQAVLAIAESDPRAALEHAASMKGQGDPFGGDPLISRLASTWARQAPLEAIAWLGAQDSSVQGTVGRSNSFGLVYSQLSSAELQAAMEKMVAEVEKAGARAIMGSILGNLARRSLDGVFEFVDSLPEELREQAEGPLLQRVAPIDPRRAEDELGRLEGRVRDRVEGQVVRAMSERDPLEALEMVQRLPEERRTESMYQAVIPQWVKTEWEAARDWFDDLPAGVERDLAMRHIEMERVRREEATPEAAFALFLEMEESWQRDSALRSLLRTWGHKDKEAALDALKGSDLEDKDKGRLEREIR